MKEVMILALKDKKNQYFTGHAIEGKRVLLKKGRWVKVDKVDVFPFKYFTALFGPYNPEITVTQVRVQVQEKKAVEKRIGDREDSLYYQKIKLLDEVQNPIETAYQIFIEKEKNSMNQTAATIRHQVLTWVHMFGFHSEEEYEFYLKFIESQEKHNNHLQNYPFRLTNFNKSYLERILLHRIPVLYYQNEERSYGLRLEEILSEVDTYTAEAFALFQYWTDFVYLDKFEESKTGRELFECLSGILGRKSDYFIASMPPHALMQYDADELFKEVFLSLYYLRKETEYQPVTEIDYINAEERKVCIITDYREAELLRISKILPLLTVKSLHLIQRLVPMVNKYLSLELYQIMPLESSE